MQECWHPDPMVRLPILRIKKTLDDAFLTSIEPMLTAPSASVSSSSQLQPQTPSTTATVRFDSGLHSEEGAPAYSLSSVSIPCGHRNEYHHRSPRDLLTIGRIIRRESEEADCQWHPLSTASSSASHKEKGTMSCNETRVCIEPNYEFSPTCLDKAWPHETPS